MGAPEAFTATADIGHFIAGRSVAARGGRSQPGLYLEIRRGAQPVDPVPWFRRSSP